MTFTTGGNTADPPGIPGATARFLADGATASATAET